MNSCFCKLIIMILLNGSMVLAKDISCSDDEFMCEDKSECIPNDWVCDDVVDCDDRSDEHQDCPDDVCLDFKCKTSGECIHTMLFCDGTPDCMDDSDEGSHCNHTCNEDMFMCEEHKDCIEEKYRCDGLDDCGDGSDEKGCDRKNVCEESGEFDCNGDGSVCIADDKVCDGRNDCEQSEDENREICKQRDPCLYHRCSHNAHCVIKLHPNNTREAKCECNSGYRWSPEREACEDIDECKEHRVCSQICINTDGGFKCQCHPGYTIQRNYSCSADGEQSWLYIASRVDIRRVRTNDFRHMEIIVEGTNNSIALDIDNTDGLMFWADAGTGNIMRGDIRNDAAIAIDIKTVISTGKEGTFSPGGLAVDWIYKNVYWTDLRYAAIKVTNYDGSKSKTLVSTGLDEPRAICVDPENGYMYWTDVGQTSKIERCGMDGQNRETIVYEGDDLQQPNSLTIDYLDKRIYWINSNVNHVGTARLDGSDKFHFAAVDVKNPFSVTVFEDFLYLADLNLNAIISTNKFNGRQVKARYWDQNHIDDIKVYHELRQTRDFEDHAKTLCMKAKCEHMCLPSIKTTINATVTCVCADDKQLNSNGRTCITTLASTENPTQVKDNIETKQQQSSSVKVSEENSETTEQQTSKSIVTTNIPTEVFTDTKQNQSLSTKFSGTTSSVSEKLTTSSPVTPKYSIETSNCTETNEEQSTVVQVSEGTEKKLDKTDMVDMNKNDTDSTDNKQGRKDSGKVAGISVGCAVASLIVIFLAGYLIYTLIKRRSRKSINILGSSVQYRRKGTASAATAEHEAAHLFVDENV